MAAKFYLGERFEHTHENQAFDQLCELVDKHWGSQGENVCLIGNVTCEGHELDALLIKENAITVIDFKNFGGELTFSENGPWYASGNEVKGGGKINPYKQIHANKFAVLNWFQRVLPDIAENSQLGHISGLVLFQQEIDFDDRSRPPRVKSWFNAGDFSSGFTWLVHLSSPGINLATRQQETIIAMLGVMEYQPVSLKITTSLAENTALKTSQKTVVWTSEQAKVIALFNQFLEQNEPRVLLISGMTSTGKKALLAGLIEDCARRNRTSECLAPNATIGAHLLTYTGKEFSSIYSHIYNMAEELEDKKIVYNPLRKKCEDDEQAVYFIAEAQLLSDNYFELDNKRFGSGKTFSDFLEFIDFKNNVKSKIVVVGDPYQLLVQGSLVDEEMYSNHGIELLVHEITEVIGEPKEDSKLQLAIELIQSLRAEKFNHLEVESRDSNLVVLSEEASDRRDAYANIFSDPLVNGQFIGFTHKRVGEVISWGRRSLLGRKGLLPEKGDILELRNKIRIWDEITGQDFYPGTYFKALSETSSQIIEEVELRGRQQPIKLVFREMSFMATQTNNTKVFNLLFLEDFLLAEKPELNIDSFVALNVLAEQEVRQDNEYKELGEQLKRAKSQSDQVHEGELKEKRKKRRRFVLAQSKYLNAAFFRFGYGNTCHHARGKKWDTVVVDASYEGTGRSNEEYFRWLYTAVTRANNTVYLDKFKSITPWANITIKSNRVQITPNIKSVWSFPYPKNQELSGSKMDRQLPEGFDNPQLELINLWLYCSKKLAEIGCIIQSVKQHQYQERYTVTNAQGQEHVLVIHYNGTFDVTNIRAEQAGNAEALLIINHLKGQIKFASDKANEVLNMIAEQLVGAGLVVEGGKEADWLLMLNLVDSENQKASIKTYYNKNSFVSTLEIEKATGNDVIDKIYKAFGLSRE